MGYKAPGRCSPLSRGTGVGPVTSSHKQPLWSPWSYENIASYVHHDVEKDGKPDLKLDLVLALSWPKAARLPHAFSLAWECLLKPAPQHPAATPKPKGLLVWVILPGLG